MNAEFRTITKAELIEQLEGLDDNALIAFSSDYGDITHTKQVHRIYGRVEACDVRRSAYSDSGWAIEEDPDHDPNCEKPVVYIIS